MIWALPVVAFGVVVWVVVRRRRRVELVAPVVQRVRTSSAYRVPGRRPSRGF